MDKYLTAEEAILYVMKRTGKTRRQAKTSLVEMMRKGKVRAQHQLKDGTFEVIPKEEFAQPLCDNEGDWFGLN